VLAGDRLLSVGLHSDIIDTRCLITMLCVTSEIPQAEAAVFPLCFGGGGGACMSPLLSPI
jgi:hypothetical protein